MRIFAVTVGRNEVGRYLEQVLRWTSTFVDGHLFYDEGSTDGSGAVATTCGCVTVTRPPEIPQFLQNEAVVREDAWRALAEAFSPTSEDWVLSIDADEFLVGDDERGWLEKNIDYAEDCNAFWMPIPEVFGWAEDMPLVRVDGFWGGITGERLARWNDDITFKAVELGGGSLPLQATPKKLALGLQILHFGYATAEDRERKYHRYSSRGGVHNPAHIESITRRGALAPWYGKQPWRST